MITYLDRVSFAQAAKDLTEVLHLNSVADLKWPLPAFAFAYAVFEIPRDGSAMFSGRGRRSFALSSVVAFHD